MEPRILVVRDPKEGANKCSLTPLRGHPDVLFANYRPGRQFDGGSRILLEVGARALEPGEPSSGLLLLDSSWRRLPSLRRTIVGDVVPRSLPSLRTAYPRASRRFADPEGGLASVEALYAAVALLWGPDPSLLDGYVAREAFLALNPAITPRGTEDIGLL